MKKVIIAEKPSVARNIADALGIKGRTNGYMEGESYIITWVFGHLLQLYDAYDYDEKMSNWRLENYPFIPDEFKYKIKSENGNRKKIDEGAKKQIGIIKSLIEREDVDSVVSATDWDREGQVIADEIFEYIDTNKYIERLLLNEWTKDEVLKGLDTLKPNSEMIPLHEAGFGRQIADWLIGINLTSVATVRYNMSGHKKLLNIGRVLLPTLKIVYDRDMEIEKFKSSSYFKLAINLTNDDIDFETLYYQMQKEDGKEDYSEKFKDKKELKDILDEIKGKSCVVSEIEKETKRENPPYLFNLSNLQGYVTGKYKGWTSDKVLKVAQNLYEKKLITYPRTASFVLDESLKDKVKKVLEVVKKGTPFEKDVKYKETKRIFDSSKVESHSAITPTYVVPKGLSADEAIVYNAVKNRFLAQFLPQAVSEETKITLKVNDYPKDACLRVKGKVQVVEGFRMAEQIQSKDVILPKVVKGEEFPIKGGSINEVVKKPPKHHTEKTLLKVMETCGKSVTEEESDEMMQAILSGFSIGTPATRAETIKKLKDAGYIEAQKKYLVCTSLGKMMVETFPVRELFDLDYTGRLEKTLADIERGKFNQDDFLNLIKDFVNKSCADVKNDRKFARGKAKGIVTGVCPECGANIVENKGGFLCENINEGCRFAVWKTDRFLEFQGKSVDQRMMKLLLENGRVGYNRLQLPGNRIGKGWLYYEKNEKTGRYQWRVEPFKEEQKKEK